MMRQHDSPRTLHALIVAALFACCDTADADNWPQWRGATGDGQCTETDLPLHWSDHENILWKCRLPEWGNSTPAVWGDAIFLTSQVNDQELVLLKLDKQTGRIVWTREVGNGSTPRGDPSPYKNRGLGYFHSEHNLATPSPVTDGEVVVVHFGNGDLAAYDFQGKKLWKRNLVQDHGAYTICWGHANSPVLHDDLVISICVQDACSDLLDPPAESYVVAHQKRTGEQMWKTIRAAPAQKMAADSYITPILHEVEGKAMLVVAGGEMLDAYDPDTGKQLWYLPDLRGHELARCPIAADGTIYTTQGLNHGLLAVRPNALGKLDQDAILWASDYARWDVPSPVLWKDRIFMVDNGGIVRCYHTLDGDEIWKARIAGEYRASPVVAGDRVYFLNTTGRTTVISASGAFEKLAENQIDAETLASPAISDGKILLRGREWLYCIGE